MLLSLSVELQAKIGCSVESGGAESGDRACSMPRLALETLCFSKPKFSTVGAVIAFTYLTAPLLDVNLDNINFLPSPLEFDGRCRHLINVAHCVSDR